MCLIIKVFVHKTSDVIDKLQINNLKGKINFLKDKKDPTFMLVKKRDCEIISGVPKKLKLIIFQYFY